jgi:lipopolysaccharide export system permease protein
VLGQDPTYSKRANYTKRNQIVLIFRYLAKEVFLSLAALTSILMFIFMSNQFVRYLNRAAAGQIPLTIIMKLMMLEVPNLMGLLLPLGFYMALLIAYGRLYADSEMTVLQACGYGLSSLLKHSYIMAGMVSLFVLIIMLWASPIIAIERAKLIRTTGIQTLIQTILPGRFTITPTGTEVLYVQSMNRAHDAGDGLFIAHQVIKNNIAQWNVLWADKAYTETDAKTQEDYLILKNGREYEGRPGQADYQVADFKEYRARLPHPTLLFKDEAKVAKTASLWPLWNPDPHKAAELQWRISVPLMVLCLTLVAIPLSRVNPRSGKFARLLPAILIYIVYANLMFIARDWVVSEKVPAWLGMWWIHILVLIIGLLLVWHNRIRAG